MTLPKWNDERTTALANLVGDESPVTKATVEAAAESLETSTRSIASKLRKLGYAVETVSQAPKAFTDTESEDLRDFVESNENAYTYAEIAANFANGKFTPRAVQGKILSLELTGMVKPTEKAEVVKVYSDAEQEILVSMINAGGFVEDIAAAVNKSVASVRGKALSLRTAGLITDMPKQREVKGQAPDSLDAIGDISKLTVAEIAEKLGKTDRGVKVMLTRRGLTASDYDGAAKAAKAAKA